MVTASPSSVSFPSVIVNAGLRATDLRLRRGSSTYIPILMSIGSSLKQRTEK